TRRTGLASFLGQRWAFVFLLLELVLFSFLGGGFFSLNGFQIILFYSTTLALLATAQTFVIVSGGPGIDLSVGFVMGFATVVSAKLAAGFDRMGLAPEVSLLLAILITLALGLLPGFVNGMLVARLKVPPFLATFAVQGITYGAALLLSSGSAAINVPNLANVIGNGYFMYWVKGWGFSFFTHPDVPRGTNVFEIVPTMVVVTILVVAVAAFVLKRTRFGRHTYAIGGNIDAALRAGINVKRHLVIVYIISSFLATLSGIIYMLEYVTGKADAGSAFMLDAVVAVVIGGASLFGGVGSVWRTILGVLILSILEMGLKMMGVPTFDKFIAVGIILIFAVLIDQFFPELIHKED
ncbi:MAG TPA: ABC transporter permease, partial [Spirochaetia bacterium]|nr:ABC transporter permease [Spirochaetia bacterium]